MTGWIALTHSQLLYLAIAPYFRVCNLAICIADVTMFGPSFQVGRGLTPLRMSVTIAHNEVFREHEQLTTKHSVLLRSGQPSRSQLPKQEGREARSPFDGRDANKVHQVSGRTPDYLHPVSAGCINT